jgi:DNA (cytosine-5)-methyltransferase 1
MNAVAYLIGAGSFTLGVQAAGFDLLQVWETPGYAKNAQTWNLNRPDLPVRVVDLDWESDHFERHYGRGNVDLIFGNPPCGGLSSMTGMRLNSPTNNCMRQWMRMVVRARPRMILMENAYQIAVDRCKPILDDLTDVLDAEGYWWWTWLFYSYQLGCPQIRRRAFVCAVVEPPAREDLVELFDLPADRDFSDPRCHTKTWIWDLEHVAPSPEPVTSAAGLRVPQHWYRERSLEWVEEAAKHRDRYKTGYCTPHEWARMMKLYEENPTIAAHKKLMKLRSKYWHDPPKILNNIMHCYRPQIPLWDGPANAIIGEYKYLHPNQDRLLTMREMARLMGYPDNWLFHQLDPHLIAQGIPSQNAYWAATRMRQICEN